MLIVLDGGEKSGKTTTITAMVEVLKLQGITNVHTRHWGPVDPDDSVYAGPLRLDCDYVAHGGWVIWDRSWASEHVYAKLLHRDRRLRDDAWIGEWFHGRAVRTLGARVMLTADLELLKANRDSTDLPVDPDEESGLFTQYARRFGWMHVHREERDTPASIALHILSAASLQQSQLNRQLAPPTYCGPRDAKIVVVGEKRGEGTHLPLPGAWLPFTSRYTIEFGRKFGDAAMEVGWTNCHDCPPEALRGAQMLVSCGKIAQLWVNNYVLNNHTEIDHVNVPHPSWLYRFNTAKTRAAREDVSQTVQSVINYFSRIKEQ